MHITLSPVRAESPRDLTRRGDTLVVDGETFDFGFIEEGSVLPCDAVGGNWLLSDVERKDGILHLTVMLPHGKNAPQETLFPVPLHVTTDGPIALPPYGDAQ